MKDLCKKYIFIVGCLLLFGCQQNVKVTKISADIFFNEPEKSSFHISPDGKFLSYLKPFQGKLNLYIQSIDKNETLQITSYQDQGIKYYFWVGNNRLFYVKDKDDNDNYQAFAVNSNGKSIKKFNTSPKTRIEVIDEMKANDNFILIAMNERVPESFDVYQLNVKTGEKVMIIKNPGNIVEWISDNNGNVKLAIGSDGVNETLYFRESTQVEFKPIISNNFKNSLQPLCFTEEKNHIYALSNLGRDKMALVDFDCSLAKETRLIYENPQADVMDVVYSKSKKKLVYLTYEISKRETHFFDDKAKEMYDNISTQLPNQELKIIDKDKLEDNFLIKTYTDKDPGAYYLYKVTDKSLVKLSDVNKGIDPSNMCPMQAISYKSRDGITIHGYLTLPLGKNKKDLPCVIMPHAGPSTRNLWGYSSEVQYLANKGYAVFQMNFRGSTGYGKAFQTAGFKQWGKKMQDDITDGVNWLIKEKIADPERIGIYGYRFGGYAALNQVIYHPELYKCAVSYSGFINLFNYLKSFPAYYKPYQQMLNEMIGNPESDADYLKYASPIFQSDKIKVPILIAQGAKDPSVNVNEMNQFVKELRKRQISVNYILKDNENHNFRDQKNKMEFYKQLGIFLDKNLNATK
ncbi:MAG: S9 family peptidase [Bacteroidetes bacterium]|nr:S9 family peptidase [Bacteroidota bacterium]MBU1372404.1 S9 family peptidase [Bacteroidota bacterium]MBU2046162.1 S9 family peptidase [Bacteroidota bacterium]MBU2376645.1 S9 family peptidase [Bacteroidota bacterium]